MIDTMPMAALHAFADHGDVSSAPGPDAAAAQNTLRRTADAGVDLDTLTAELEHESGRCVLRLLPRAARLDRDAAATASPIKAHVRPSVRRSTISAPAP